MDVKLKNWKRKSLPEDELKGLIKKAQSGNIEARNKIVENSIWLVGTVNSRYSNTEDGFQQGILGLIEAVEKYDMSVETKFSTYAYYWITQKIDRYINKNAYKTSHNLIFLYKELQKFSGTKEEFFIKKKLAPKTILALEKMSSQSEIELEDYNGRDDSTLDEINNFILKDYVDGLLKKYCTEQEEYILRKIFFEENGRKELLKEFKCSRQWLNEIKNKILSKLRKAIYEDNNY